MEGPFDIIILNSVIHNFSGIHYLRDVIKKAISLVSENGIMFIGDIMNLELKEDLLHSLKAYNVQGHKTKTDYPAELFVLKAFFKDLEADFSEIKDVVFSDKIYTIENELTKFRYDAMFIIDKQSVPVKANRKQKYQLDYQ